MLYKYILDFSMVEEKMVTNFATQVRPKMIDGDFMQKRIDNLIEDAYWFVYKSLYKNNLMQCRFVKYGVSINDGWPI